MRHFLKITALMSSVTLVNIALNIIKVKVMALMVGTTGIGLFSLFQSIYNVFLSVGSIVAGGSIVNAVAEARQGEDCRKLYVLQYVFLRVAIVLGLLCGIGLYFYRNRLAMNVFDDLAYANMLSWIGIVLIFVNLSLFWQSWLNGYRQIKKIAKVRLYSSMLISFSTILLVYMFGNQGIIFAVLILPLPSFFLARYYSTPVKDNTNSHISWKELFSLSNVFILGLMLSLTSLIFQVGIFGARSIIIELDGIESAGIAFAAWAISMSYIEIFLGALSVDYYPALIENKNNKPNTLKLINNQLHFLLLLLFPILMLMFIFSSFIIVLLYSSNFLIASSILKYQLIGDVFKVLAWTLGYVLIVQGYLKFLVLLQCFWVGIYLLIIWVGFDIFGLDVTGISFLISYFLSALLSYLYLKNKTGFVFSQKNITLLKIIIFASLILLGFHFFEIENHYIITLEILMITVFSYKSYKTIYAEGFSK